MDWEECKESLLAKESKVDKSLVDSLLKTSSDKLKSQDLMRLDDVTASSKISLVYDALRELLEALAISKGLKIYNHECYCAFLNELLNEPSLSRKFDNFRKIRNSINYYGKRISAEEAGSIIEEMLGFIENLKGKYLSRPSP